MKDQLQFFLYVFTSLFTLVNPLSVLPVLLSSTQGLSRADFLKIARKACLAMFLAIIGFSLVGKILFDFFSISIHGLRIVGGILFLITGYDMLQARVVRLKSDQDESLRAGGEDFAITPLAIPMLCGPGTITATLVIIQEANEPMKRASFYLGVTFIALLCYLVFIWGGRVMKVMGESGNKVFLRIMGLIMMVIAVEFFFSGLKGIWKA